MSEIAPDLKTANYYFDDRHFVLSDPKPTAFGPNIGGDGRNLTIALLSLNRAKLSVRLIDSIAEHLVNFAGEVLIGDNGSEPLEIEQLRAGLQRLPHRWRLLEFGKNLGVADGRNRLMAEVRTDWVISLDNDIYFTANPLLQIQSELATLGCHFMSFPLLNPDGKTIYSHGGCLQTVLQDGRPRLTLNPIAAGLSLERGPEDLQHAFLCSFLFGGASVFNRHSFERLGGFDAGMFIGFEDIDFSLRLFREGMKVATSAARFLVHDHPKAETTSDTKYEKTRYARKALYDSALYLEAKTGFRIWGDEIEDWMRSSGQRQGWNPDVPTVEPAPAVASQRTRPRIALITDTADWAFSNISRQLKRYLGDRFDFEIIPLVTLGEIERNRWFGTNCQGFFAEGGASALGMALVATEDFDITHIFWREFLTIVDTPLLEDYARRVGMSYPEFRHRFIEDRILSTSVYDHLFLDTAGVAQREKIFTELTSGYYVVSERLKKIYQAIPSLPDPMAVLPDGVDLSLFKPEALDRFDTIAERPIRIGWVGHSGWASTLEDFKGVESILKPALDQLRNEGVPLVADFADRKDGFIPHARMPEYYAGIDLLVCTSKIEGTPNPVLEAMACGIPVITTDVGIVPEVFGEKQKEFILAERSVACLKEAILRLLARPAQFRELSRENLAFIKKWDWSQRAESFADYFSGLLTRNRAAEGGGQTGRRILPSERRSLESGEAMTKMCMLPFSNPSMEPDGSIRLCSASSIFDYYEETNMGNCQEDGLLSVWKGERYRQVRKGLLTGIDLKPYCEACDYRFEAPVWMMQLHLGLHAYHNGTRTDEVLALIGRRVDRYEEYRSRAPSLSLAAYGVNEEIRTAARRAFLLQEGGRVPFGRRIAPEALIDCATMPIYMDFNTLNRCNVSCTMCPPAIRHDKLGVKRDPYFRLTLDQYKAITNGITISTAHFVGAYAEPLMNKEIFSLISHAHGQGAVTAITTNATALSRNFGERLLDAGLDMMTISLHGATPATAESIMLKSDFEKIVANIRVFQRLKEERGTAKPEIYFNYVTQKANAHEMPAFVELAHELGVKFVNFIHLIDGDEAVDKSESLANHPELVVRNVIQAQERADQLGISLYVSPAHAEIAAQHAEPSSQSKIQAG
jgi:MoaA/NifB/PqqE/SkfB family radical SAM enzyme/GT2 family glycosyltransferase